MPPFPLRPLARCAPAYLLSSTSSRHLSTFSALRSKTQLGEDPERACGVPLNATEAGPREPGGILRPGLWIIGPSAVLTVMAFYLFMPNDDSRSGRALERRIRGQRKTLERREGDREEEETDAQRMEEREIVENAAREKRDGMTAG
ncbi:hypothetical protein MMC13_007292 [Lambiella insularis]|nr:hypothetical protein [Lambiella insularis]